MTSNGGPIKATSKLTALLLALVLTTPALAQAPDEKVTVTIELALYGDVPEGENFGAVGMLPQREAEGYVDLCGSSDPQGGSAKEPCVGKGRIYTAEFPLPLNAGTLDYAFQRLDAKGRLIHSFRWDSTTFDRNNTIGASYRFPAGDDTQDEAQDMPEKLPATGTGGMAGAGLPLPRHSVNEASLRRGRLFVVPGRWSDSGCNLREVRRINQ